MILLRSEYGHAVMIHEVTLISVSFGRVLTFRNHRTENRGPPLQLGQHVEKLLFYDPLFGILVRESLHQSARVVCLKKA